jgi:Ca2+-binding EF-hand superfamily protein
MFNYADSERTGHLRTNQFKQLLHRFDIDLDHDEFYHLYSEIDRNQDGLISYNELYRSLISDVLQC